MGNIFGPFLVLEIPVKIKMEPNSKGLEDAFPFQTGEV